VHSGGARKRTKADVNDEEGDSSEHGGNSSTPPSKSRKRLASATPFEGEGEMRTGALWWYVCGCVVVRLFTSVL
jgi:hypothetical protein